MAAASTKKSLSEALSCGTRDELPWLVIATIIILIAVSAESVWFARTYVPFGNVGGFFVCTRAVALFT